MAAIPFWCNTEP